MIRVLLAEDQGLMRSALAALLALEDDLDVVGQVARVADIVPAVQAGRPDVALLDIELADGNALDVAPAVRSVRPDCAVVFLTTFGRPGYLRRAFDAGHEGSSSRTGRSRSWRHRSAWSTTAGPWSTRSWPRPRWPTAAAR